MRDSTLPLGVRQPSPPLYESPFISLMRAKAKRNGKQNKQCPDGCGFWFQKVNAGLDGEASMICPNCATVVDPETFFDK